MAEDPIATPRAKQPWPFPFNILHEEWPEVKKAKLSFFLCSVVCLLIGGWIVYFLFASFVIPGKDATIQALHTKPETPPGIYSGWPSVIWQGPTNSLYVTNEYCFYQASGNCTITNVVNPSSTATSWAEFVVYNTSSNTIVVYMIVPAVRPIGSVTTNAFRIAPGKLGYTSFECIGQTISSYVNLPQQ